MPTAMHREARRRRSSDDEGDYKRSDYSRHGALRSERRKEYRSRSRSRRREKRARFYRGSSGTRTKRRSDDRRMRLKQMHDQYTVRFNAFVRFRILDFISLQVTNGLRPN